MFTIKASSNKWSLSSRSSNYIRYHLLRGLNTQILHRNPLLTANDDDNKTATKDDHERHTMSSSTEHKSTGGRANEIIEAVLYGSKRIKEIEKQTYSKILARGKYVHELQIHKVKPGKVDEYTKLVSNHLPKIASDPLNDVHLCGSWSVGIGDQDSFVHIWEYKGYPGHKQTSERLEKDKDHIEFMKRLRPLLISRQNAIMLEFSFWQTSPPKVTNGIFELRKYNLKPGRLLEWEMYW
ncbi:MAG: hypothetical protein EXX96DRAFT_479706 [Benjaminiella poitrasii]|nr:MAG: hypothetical protein EXX96DRAFT_479706 [Benjaminiella poitrasii]